MSSSTRTVWLSAALLLATAPRSLPSQSVGEVEVETRTLPAEDGEAIRYEVGTLYVPENRTVPNSRVIGVGFARLRAKKQLPSITRFDLLLLDVNLPIVSGEVVMISVGFSDSFKRPGYIVVMSAAS